MPRKPLPIEFLLLSTAIGIAATFAAPWLELRGTYAAWRIVEWHTFWRGESAFQLASVVASNYHVSVEYATGEMQLILRACFALGSALGLWHAGVLIALLVIGARMRLRAGASWPRVALEFAAIVVLNAAVIYLLALLLALPSSLTPKVDFRAGAEIHSDSLIWSDVTVLPVAPAFALIALAVDGFALIKLVRERQSPISNL
ncbi:MAG TPA: hypothetical protein VF478_02030 [Anaerolineae bacterium]